MDSNVNLQLLKIFRIIFQQWHLEKHFECTQEEGAKVIMKLRESESENDDDIISAEKYPRVAIEHFNIGDVPLIEGQTREWQSHKISRIF